MLVDCRNDGDPFVGGGSGSGSGSSAKADRLCVLVHGLWGKPSDMRNIAKALREHYGSDTLHLLLARRNCGGFTYDGIELGGERVCAEIEDELRAVKARGGRITKLSVIGYSLGGLVSRYAVGLLYAKGILDNVECMNFVTFASPHLGVRTPLKGWHNHVWNVIGARSLSMSGRQLFAIDKFRETGRPLLSVMADPTSIFMLGQRKFKRHTLYTNIVNDRSAVFYTTGIQKTDPFMRDLDTITPNYVEDGGDVILDPDKPYMALPALPATPTLSSATLTLLRWLRRVPLMIVFAVLVPIGTLAFLINTAVLTVRSSGRIREHEKGQTKAEAETYRVPLLINELRGGVERAYGAINSAQDHHYLAAGDDEDDNGSGSGSGSGSGDATKRAEQRRVLRRERRMSLVSQPTLALTAEQFEMIDSLDSLGWRKYPVWIHHDTHAHAAMIARIDKKTPSEGWIVLKHFAEKEFVTA